MMAWGMLLSIDRVKAPTLVLAPRVRDKTSFFVELSRMAEDNRFCQWKLSKLRLNWLAFSGCLLSEPNRAHSHFQKIYCGPGLYTGGAAQLAINWAKARIA